MVIIFILQQIEQMIILNFLTFNQTRSTFLIDYTKKAEGPIGFQEHCLHRLFKQ